MTNAVDKHFKLVSLTSVVRVLFMPYELSSSNPPSPPPAYNIPNGSYDQYVVEVAGSCSQ